MFNRIKMTTNINYVENNMFRKDVIVILLVDTISDMQEVTNNATIIDRTEVASILLPPYQIIQTELDGDLESYKMQYYNYLTGSIDVGRYLTLIFLAIKNGYEIIFYVKPDMYEHFNFAKTFISYINDVFGIRIGVNNEPTIFPMKSLWCINEMLYLNNYMTVDMLILSNPTITYSNLNILNKMCGEFGIYIINYDDASIAKAIEQIEVYRALILEKCELLTGKLKQFKIPFNIKV